MGLMFNVIDNVRPDIFHDMPKGVEKVEFDQSLKYLVKKATSNLNNLIEDESFTTDKLLKSQINFSLYIC